MTTITFNQGSRIRNLFKGSRGDISIISPFIKKRALCSLLEVIPSGVYVRCVTRWIPEEIASGISDPDIIDVLENRGDYKLTLVDNLHAKLYIAENICLVGSANVTLQGLGDLDSGNIEILVETSISDPGVRDTLSNISRVEKIATLETADKMVALASSLPPHDLNFGGEGFWFPYSTKPEKAYDLYMHPTDVYIAETDRILLWDIERARIPYGLSVEKFKFEVCNLLEEIPLTRGLLDAKFDMIINKAEAYPYLSPLITEEYTIDDLWRSFVRWMVFFFPDKVMLQEISELGLRRARLIK